MKNLGKLIGIVITLAASAAQAEEHGLSWERMSWWERSSIVPAGVVLDVGPSVQFGGSVPNVVMAGGGVHLGLIIPVWFVSERLGVSWMMGYDRLTMVTPANIYGADVRPNLWMPVLEGCIRYHPFGVCAGSTQEIYYFNRTPSSENDSRTGWGSTILRTDMIIRTKKWLAWRPIVSLEFRDGISPLRVDRNDQQRWVPASIAGMLSVQLLLIAGPFLTDKPTAGTTCCVKENE